MGTIVSDGNLSRNSRSGCCHGRLILAGCEINKTYSRTNNEDAGNRNTHKKMMLPIINCIGSFTGLPATVLKQHAQRCRCDEEGFDSSFNIIVTFRHPTSPHQRGDN